MMYPQIGSQIDSQAEVKTGLPSGDSFISCSGRDREKRHLVNHSVKDRTDDHHQQHHHNQLYCFAIHSHPSLFRTSSSHSASYPDVIDDKLWILSRLEASLASESCGPFGVKILPKTFLTIFFPDHHPVYRRTDLFGNFIGEREGYVLVFFPMFIYFKKSYLTWFCKLVNIFCLPLIPV